MPKVSKINIDNSINQKENLLKVSPFEYCSTPYFKCLKIRINRFGKSQMMLPPLWKIADNFKTSLSNYLKYCFGKKVI